MTVRVGVLGLGSVFEKYGQMLEELCREGRVQVTAVYDPGPGLSEAQAARFGIRRSDGSAESLIDRDDEIRPHRKHVRIATRKGMATRNIDRDRQPLRRIGTPGMERFDARWFWE